MIAVTGAVITFATLAAIRCGFKRSFASTVVTNTKRAGEQFALVGPQRIKS